MPSTTTRTLTLCALLLISITTARAQTAVGVADFVKRVQTQPGVVLDVRTPDEWNRGHVAGARLYNFMRNDFKQRVDSLDRSKTYYLYCASGGRSGDAAELMAGMGFKSVYTLTQAGFRDLKAAGLKTE
jgi:phage shock protein E